MNKIKKLIPIMICMILMVTVAVYLPALGTVKTVQAAVETTGYRVNDGEYDDYTDFLEPKGVDVTQYYEAFATHSRVEGLNRKYYVKDQDPITKLVPFELFTKPGTETFHLGREYGFYIKTEPAPYRTGALHSRVALLLIEREENMIETKDHLKFTVSKIFEAEYAYVTSAVEETLTHGSTIGSTTSDSYSQYTMQLCREGNAIGVKGLVIPISYGDEFRQSNRFYFRDFASSVSLYNENHFNQFDQEYYDPYQDQGAYFTQTDFAYEGTFYEPGGRVSGWDGGTVALSAAALAWDVFSELSECALVTTIKAIPLVGLVPSLIDAAVSIHELGEKVSGKLTSTEKKLTYVPQFTYRDQQLEENGFLNKDAVIATSSIDDRKLFMGTGESITFDYQINGLNHNWDTRYAWQLGMGVTEIRNHQTGVLSSTHFTTLGQYQSNVYSDMLKLNRETAPEAPTVAMTDSETIGIFPSATPKRTVSIEHGSYYRFEAQNDNVDFALCTQGIDPLSAPIASSTRQGSSSVIEEVYLEPGEYVVTFQQRDDTKILQFPFRYEFTPRYAEHGDGVLAFDNTQEQFFRYTANKHATYKFQADDPTAKISLVNRNFETIEESDTNALSSILGNGETCYIRVALTEAVTKNVGISIVKQREIAFDSAGGEEISSYIIQDDDANFSLPTPTRRGYIFDGWEYDGGGSVTGSADIVEKDEPIIRLRACWTPINYTVFYEENGGQSLSNGTYNIQQAYELLIPIREGYTFLGWYDQAELTGERVERVYTGETEDKTFYADWVLTQQIITLDVNQTETDGKEASLSEKEKTVVYGERYRLPVPEAVGFTFDGWYANGVKYTDAVGECVLPYTQRDHLALIAKWSRNVYYFQISFKHDADAGFDVKWLTQDGLTQDKNGAAFEAGICPDCWIRHKVDVSEYYKEGHILKGLLTDPSNPDSFACWGNVFPAVKNGETIALYANYEKEEKFKIVFYRYAEVEMPAIEKNFGDKIDLPQPEKEHYEFCGWIVADYEKNQRFDGTIFHKLSEFNYHTMPDFSVGKQENGVSIYLDAVFQPKVYTVTFTYQGKSVEFPVKYGTYLTGAPTDKRGGYTFVGWTDGTTILVNANGESIGPWLQGEATLIPKFEANTYVLTYWDPVTQYHATQAIQYQYEFVTHSYIRTHYQGFWNINGQRIPMGDKITYTTIGNTTATAEWEGNIYDVVYQNLKFGSRNGFAHSRTDEDIYRYRYGQGKDLSAITGIIIKYVLGEAEFQFLGWYEDMGLKYKITKILSTRTGPVTVYAKWRIDVFSSMRSTEYKITDAGPFQQGNQYDQISPIYIWDSASYLDIYQAGFRYLTLNIALRLWEVNDGYREIYIYGGEDGVKLLWSVKFEYGSGSIKRDKAVYATRVNIPLDKIKDETQIYIRYSASGVGADTWKNDKIYIEEMYTVKTDDLYAMPYYWGKDNPFSDKGINFDAPGIYV